MAVNDYPTPPMSRGGVPIWDAVTHASVKGIWASENKSVSSIIILTPDTTFLEIAAFGTGAAFKFYTQAVVDSSVAGTSVITAAGTANYDHVIAPNTVAKVAIPVNTLYQAPSSMVGANIRNGLYRHIGVKAVGVGSVLLTEY